MTSIHDESNRIIAAALDVHTIGNAGGHAVTGLQIMLPMGNRTRFEAVMRDADRRVVAQFEADDYQTLRTHLAADYEIGLKYTDLIYAKTVSFYSRQDKADRYNEQHQSQMLSQFETEHVVYSVIHQPATVYADFDITKDHVNPGYYRAIAQLKSEEDPDDCLIFDNVTDTLFEAVVEIRNHIEKALFSKFVPGFDAKVECFLKPGAL